MSMPGKVLNSIYILLQARTEKRLPYWTAEKILRLQNRRVHDAVRYADQTVPFYRDFMKQNSMRPEHFRTAEDLARLHMITGEQLSAERDGQQSSKQTGQRCPAEVRAGRKTAT